MEHFVTLFDSLFLPQGLALRCSLERHIKEYTLWILCIDDDAHDVLGRLNLPNVRLLKLSSLETEELKRVKHRRTPAEYCWTLTPFAPRFVFEADSDVSRVTYLDADLWFRKHPRPIFQEFEASGMAVLITDHAYSPEYDQSATSGQYCVQFLTFVREAGEAVRSRWEDQCIEWCYARFEKGKFGDQKYLDDWPEAFADVVHVLENEGLALAPWNASRFPYGGAVFYHFHETRLLSRNKVHIGLYSLPKVVIDMVYTPYLKDLREAICVLESVGVSPRSQVSSEGVVRDMLKRLRRVSRRAGPYLRRPLLRM